MPDMKTSNPAPKSATEQAFSLAAPTADLPCSALRDFASFIRD
jgi:hypothetical protein